MRPVEHIDERLEQLVGDLHDPAAKQDTAVSVEALVARALGQQCQHTAGRGDHAPECAEDEGADEIRHVWA